MSMGIPNPLLWSAIVCNYLAISARRLDQPDIQQHRTTIVFVVLAILFVNTRSVRPASRYWGSLEAGIEGGWGLIQGVVRLFWLFPLFRILRALIHCLHWQGRLCHGCPFLKPDTTRFILVAINIASLLLWTIWPLLRIKQEALMTPAIAVIWC